MITYNSFNDKHFSDRHDSSLVGYCVSVTEL